MNQSARDAKKKRPSEENERQKNICDKSELLLQQ